VIVTVDYTWHGKLENEMNNRGYTISNTEFMEHVKMTLLTLEGEEDHFIRMLTNLTNGQASITTGDLVYVDTPVESSNEEEWYPPMPFKTSPVTESWILVLKGILC
jgi:hypothetical protein